MAERRRTKADEFLDALTDCYLDGGRIRISGAKGFREVPPTDGPGMVAPIDSVVDRDGAAAITIGDQRFRVILGSMMRQPQVQPDPLRADSHTPITVGMHLSFEDGSIEEMTWPQPDAQALDQGLALLEPITVAEYRSIERLLDELWKAIDNGALEEHHLLQLRLMYDVLFEDHRATEAGVDARHKLVGTVRAVALLSNHEGVRAGLAWWKLAEILIGINWHTIARIFPGGPA